MDEQEQIKLLQEELTKLTGQLHLQQQKINDLQRRLSQLKTVNGSSGSALPAHNSTYHLSLENFIGLRLIHFIGIIVLVIGLSIGVKYAIDRNLVSETMRIGLAYLAGAVLFLLSVRLKKRYILFSAILFSGGMASLYFTTYAAFVYYSMFSFGIAFSIMIALTVFTVYEAIKYDRQEIALLGLVGAYGIPFLISKNADRADLFFLYIGLINAGVVFLCIKKRWKQVGRVADAITWILFIAWAAMRLTIEMHATGFFYMSFFFFLFLFSSVSLRLFYKERLTINDSYRVVLNNMALFIASLFIFGSAFDHSDIAIITVTLAGLTSLQAIIVHYLWRNEYQLARMLSALALIFFVLFIYFEWSGLSVTLLWLLTAVILFTFGVLLKSVPARLSSIILMGATLFKLLVFDSLTFTSIQKVISYMVLGILLLIVSFFYQKFKEQLFHDSTE